MNAIENDWLRLRDEPPPEACRCWVVGPGYRGIGTVRHREAHGWLISVGGTDYTIGDFVRINAYLKFSGPIPEPRPEAVGSTAQ